MLELEEGQAYIDALQTYFGIELDAPYEDLRPLPKAGQENGIVQRIIGREI